MKPKKVKKRIWTPKCRAEKFADKRTKRKKTRAERNKQAIREFS